MGILNTHADAIILVVICLTLLILSFVGGLKSARRRFLIAAAFLALSAILIVTAKIKPRDEFLVANTGRAIDHAAIICWWLAGALIFSATLHYVVNRWIFPAQDQPRARKLFADLSAGLIYLVAGVGILNVLVGPSLPGMLATSGVAAVVLGLALQSTLADLFSGLALNFERPFGAGEWIGIQGGPEGQIIEINWRATRLMTPGGDMVVIPNSNIAKAVVSNHSRLNHHHLVALSIPFPQTASPDKINEIVLSSAAAVPMVLKAPAPTLSMMGTGNLGITYELDFYVSDYVDGPAARSEILRRVWENTKHSGIEFPTLTLGDIAIAPGSRCI